EPTATFTIDTHSISSTLPRGSLNAYFNYTLQEYSVPSNTAATDYLSFDIVNSTAGTGAATSGLFQLNYSSTNSNSPGTRNNMTYTSTQGHQVNAQMGFHTEKGSYIATISPTSLTVDLAKAYGMLEFTVGPVNASVATTTHVAGPFGVGQATNIPNVTIANVTATCSFSTTSCSVTGLSNLTAVPSVTSAITPVRLNTATTPLVVLDSNANPASTLIVVGSKYVNSVAAQIFSQNPSLDSSFGPGSVIVQAFGTNRILVAGFTANETVQAGNEFIQDLLANAST
ncbi:MAG: hypothetical protein QXL16_02085, partial [Candidatus Micrarchaeaceae archaeon]